MATESFKGQHVHYDMIRQRIRWYLINALNSRDMENSMAVRGVAVGHGTMNRWIIQHSPQLKTAFRQKNRIHTHWILDET